MQKSESNTDTLLSSQAVNATLDMQMMNKQPSQMPSQPPMQVPMQPPVVQPEMTRIVYPEIFYKLQPYIIMICDEMDAYNCQMPTQEMVEQMTDNIYDDICQMHPDLVKYVEQNEKTFNTDSEAAEVVVPFIPGGYSRRHFRRRGPLRDIIDILLFSELFRRRRRYNY